MDEVIHHHVVKYLRVSPAVSRGRRHATSTCSRWHARVTPSSYRSWRPIRAKEPGGWRA